MMLRTVEHVLEAFVLPKHMEWLEKKLSWHPNAKGEKVLSPTLVKDGHYYTLEFRIKELRGLALYTVTSRIRNAITAFQLQLRNGTARRLNVEKGEGIE